jgi:hypothetical protein
MKLFTVILFALSANAQMLAGVDKDTNVIGTAQVQKNFCAGAGKNPKDECAEWAGEVQGALQEKGVLVLKLACDTDGVMGCTYTGSVSGKVYFVR